MPGRAASWLQQDLQPSPVRVYRKVTVFPCQGRLLFHCRDNDQSDCGDQCEKLENFCSTHGEPPPPAWNPDRAAHRSPLGQTVSRLTGKMYHLLRGLSRENAAPRGAQTPKRGPDRIPYLKKVRKSAKISDKSVAQRRDCVLQYRRRLKKVRKSAKISDRRRRLCSTRGGSTWMR